MNIGNSYKVPGYHHINMLNGYAFPKDKSTVFKYMPLDRLVQSVDKGVLVFVSPETWYDPFEQLYYGIDCTSKGYATEDIACMCVSEKSSTNEDASWRVYAGTNNKTVRISLEQDKLLQLLDGYAEFNGFEVYMTKEGISSMRTPPFPKKHLRISSKIPRPWQKLLCRWTAPMQKKARYSL